MPLPTVGEECAVAFQVVLVDIRIPMPRAVVLVYPPSPVEPQVGTSYEAVPLVEDLLLRGHRNLGCLVQYTHNRLPSGLAPRIEQREDLSQQRCTAPPLTGGDLEIGQGAVPQPQRRVAEDDQIEHTEVARSSENRLGRRGYPQPADQ